MMQGEEGSVYSSQTQDSDSGGRPEEPEGQRRGGHEVDESIGTAGSRPIENRYQQKAFSGSYGLPQATNRA